MPRKKKDWLKKKGKKTVSFDADQEFVDELDELAAEYGISKSQLLMAMGYMSLKQIKKGALDSYLSPSRSPAFRYSIDLDKIRDDYS